MCLHLLTRVRKRRSGPHRTLRNLPKSVEQSAGIGPTVALIAGQPWPKLFESSAPNSPIPVRIWAMPPKQANVARVRLEPFSDPTKSRTCPIWEKIGACIPKVCATQNAAWNMQRVHVWVCVHVCVCDLAAGLPGLLMVAINVRRRLRARARLRREEPRAPIIVAGGGDGGDAGRRLHDAVDPHPILVHAAEALGARASAARCDRANVRGTGARSYDESRRSSVGVGRRLSVVATRHPNLTHVAKAQGGQQALRCACERTMDNGAHCECATLGNKRSKMIVLPPWVDPKTTRCAGCVAKLQWRGPRQASVVGRRRWVVARGRSSSLTVGRSTSVRARVRRSASTVALGRCRHGGLERQQVRSSLRLWARGPGLGLRGMSLQKVDFGGSPVAARKLDQRDLPPEKGAQSSDMYDTRCLSSAKRILGVTARSGRPGRDLQCRLRGRSRIRKNGLWFRPELCAHVCGRASC